VAADYGVLTIDPTPASMQVGNVPHRAPVRFVPYNGTGVLPPWLLDKPERPRMLVSWSTMNTMVGGADGFFVHTILDALSELDVDVVVTIPRSDLALLGEVPSGVRVAQVAHLLLTPTCDAIIHHGGSGTTLTAAVNAVPQLIIGAELDQIFAAQQLAGTGAGFGFKAEDTGVDDIRTAARAALSDPAVREAAQRLRDEMLAAPTPAELVGALEDLAA
jgi:UDP:flavonoid glycosyltransferase YjiC (YdhE family)